MKMNFTSSFERKAFSLVAFAMMALGTDAYAQSLTSLSGSTAGSASGEGFAQLVDGKVATKWGQTFDANNIPWTIFKADEALVPKEYFLITGNDTGLFPERNWSSWKIYGANFESDEEAVREAEGWVLIDQKSRANLPSENFATVRLSCSEAPTESYKYFRIEVEATNSVQSTYMQMSEFGFGDPNELEEAYVYIWSTEGDGGERGFNLIDKTNNRWGYDSGNHTGVVMFRSTKALKPTYYTLLTGGDNEKWTRRNWKDYSIYGGNFESEEAARADYDNHIKERDFEGFKLLEKRVDIGLDVLPDKNFYEVYMDMETPATEAFEYFLILVDKSLGGGWCQMTEFTWGNAESFVLKRTELFNSYSEFDHSVLAWQALYDEYDKLVPTLLDAQLPSALSAVKWNLEELKDQIKASNKLYLDYVEIVNQVRRSVENNAFTDETVAAQLKDYVAEEEIAPNETYPAGSYAYIVNHRQLNDAEVKAETRRLALLNDEYGAQVDPIDVTYEALEGSEGFSGSEGFASLIDGDDGTKWCHMHNDGLSYVIFKTSEAIAPTMVRMVTGNDTGGNPGRNWKKWKVFAANFDSDAAATKDAEDWVVIDDQSDASLPAEDTKATFRSLSAPSETPYQYFKIEIYESAGQDRMQMATFEFLNQGNFRKLRADYVEEFRETYELTEDGTFVAQRALIDQFRETYEEMMLASNLIELGTLYNQLKNCQNALNESSAKYEELSLLVEEMLSYSFENPVDIAFFEKYLSQELAPEELAPYGSLPYAMANGTLSNDDINKVITHLKSTKDALDANADGVHLPVGLDGSGTWGDGAYLQLFDGKSETKWGGSYSGEMYCIVKYLDENPIVPFFYQLQTGWDAASQGHRNWKDWKIYGGNFASDFEATRGAEEGWVLIEDKVDCLDRRLPNINGVWAPFGFSNAENIPAEGFRYYMIIVTKTRGENNDQQQMSQLVFGEEADFAEVRDRYVDELNANSVEGLVADVALLTEYTAAVAEVDGSTGIEDMFLKYYAALDAWDAVQTSIEAYARYVDATDKVALFLEENPLDESDALANLNAYLEGNVEPSEEGYPNGSKQYIVENHVLNDSTVLAEIDYLETLKAAAVRVGFVAGTEITSLLSNPTFAKGDEGWDGTGVHAYNTYNNVNYGYISAAECVEMDTLDLSQTLTGLKNGLYLLEMGAGYRAAGDYESYNHVAYIYANDNIVPVWTSREGMIAKDEAIDGLNSNLTGEWKDVEIINKESSIENDTIGFVFCGVLGSAIAFNAGRYMNAVVANVTDGTLKVGIRNPFSAAPNTQEWVGFGNTKLTYLGEVATADVEALDKALTSCSGRAATMAELYEALPDENYAKAPNFSAEERAGLLALNEQVAETATAQEKYELVVKYSDLFKSVAKTKDAYVYYFKKNLGVFDRWIDQVDYMSAELSEEFNTDIIDGQGKWLGGDFSAEEAVKEGDLLVVKYPDYMSEVADEGILPCPANLMQDAPFTYDFELGEKSTMVALRGMYDALEDDEIILTFEYKTEAEDVKTYAFFNNPGVSYARSLLLEGMEPSADWKTMYYNVSHARIGNFTEGSALTPWGQSTDHGIGFEFEGGSGKLMSIRNVRMTTLKAVEEAGGTVGIGQVVDREPALQQKGIYTLSGTRVNKATKGLYIIDGKKVIVKD